jgi:hypothetical protein
MLTAWQTVNTSQSELTVNEPSENGQLFTWKQIKKCKDLSDWQHSQYKTLRDYMKQGMFSEPMT